MKITITLLFMALTSAGMLIGSHFSQPDCEEELNEARAEIKKYKQIATREKRIATIAQSEARKSEALAQSILTKTDSLTQVIERLQSK